tara:strand:+ start:2130 stop:4262 length:2133 start_codon:yes stop_codon:yes gene_type:complete
MLTVLDVETTFVMGEGRRTDPSPFNPDNSLVSVQYWSCVKDKTMFSNSYIPPQIAWFYHKDLSPDTAKSHEEVQKVLDKTTLLVGHNIKFDLMWLQESGFKYSGKVYDTMIGEYVLLRCKKLGLSLADSCIRRKVSAKKSELVDNYLKDGVGFDTMPPETVEEYGLADIVSTRELYMEQQKLFGQQKNSNLKPHLNLMNAFLRVLATIERNGIMINTTTLDNVREEYKTEKAHLERTMEDIAYSVMGDTKVNFASPEQLSNMVYSRKVIDKKKWAEIFNIGLDENGKPFRRSFMTQKKFIQNIQENTSRIFKTKARHCHYCSGKGQFYKQKKNGEQWKNPTKCKTCSGRGYILDNLPKVGGLTMNPQDMKDVSANGFATDKSTMLRLLKSAKMRGNDTAVEFLKSATRLNAVDVYLSSFVGGIARNTRANNLLHPKFNQCITRTTRLSSSDPNFQNQPRGNTFPVRAVVVSRFENGKILQADYSQLEFRVAAQLCGDDVMKQDIASGRDVHRYTASIIFNKEEKDVTKDERTEAKAHTFKPLYGGISGTPNEMAYYKAFVDKYKKLGEWHESLQTEAISEGSIAMHTGQQFAFPDTRRLSSGSASNAPAIKNYPVQGIAGGCIVPLALITLTNSFAVAGLRSLIVNTVHDSIVIDVFPGEEFICATLTHDAMTGVPKVYEELYNVKWTVPLDVDVEIGQNWLDMKTFDLT